MGTQNGLWSRVEEYFKKTPTKLYTWEDIQKQFKLENPVAAQNAVYNLYRSDRIKMHKDKCPETNLKRYAYHIGPENAVAYVPQERGKRKKSTDIMTPREVSSLFAQVQNNLAKLEDAMMVMSEQANEVHKMMEKIKNLTT